MRTVFKYHLDKPGPFKLPQGAVIRCVAEQHGRPALWAEVDSEAPLVHWRIMVVGTGHPVPENCNYVGTMLCHAGSLVLHVYDGGPAI